MQKSDSIANLAAALSAAQAEFPTVAKSADNPFFKSKYSNLASIIEAVQPVLGKHGLSVSQIPSTDVLNKMITVTTVLAHKSGEYLSGEFSMPVPDWKAQGLGSAITYACRYSLAPMLRVASDKDDDDGNAASARTNGETNEFAPRPKSDAKKFNDSLAPKSPAKTSTVVLPKAEVETAQPSPFLEPHQVRTFWIDCKKVGGTETILRKVLKQGFGIESTKEIKIGQVGEILEAVREAVAPESHGQPLGEF